MMGPAGLGQEGGNSRAPSAQRLRQGRPRSLGIGAGSLWGLLFFWRAVSLITPIRAGSGGALPQRRGHCSGQCASSLPMQRLSHEGPGHCGSGRPRKFKVPAPGFFTRAKPGLITVTTPKGRHARGESPIADALSPLHRTHSYSITTTNTTLPRAGASRRVHDVGPSSLSHHGRIRRHIRQHAARRRNWAFTPPKCCTLTGSSATTCELRLGRGTNKAARAVTEPRTRRACDLSTAGSCLPCYEANCRRSTTTGCSSSARKPPSPSPLR